MKVYIIQSDMGLGIEFENRAATLNKDIAKQYIKDEILDNCDEDVYDNDYVDKFAQDLVDGNTIDHYCDEFDGIRIWCDILNIIENREDEKD